MNFKISLMALKSLWWMNIRTQTFSRKVLFEIAQAAIKNGGSMIVVGDDNRSLYRFRGATVDFFKDFKERIKLKLNVEPYFINLSQNYRSTDNIVDFNNSYISLDRKFQDSRVKGKEPIVACGDKHYQNFPVMGMFREDIKMLAQDLAQFIYKFFHGEGFYLKENGFKIKIDEREDSPGDIALLCSSPMEQDFKGNPRLSYLLKEELSKYNPQIHVFNPRGQHLGRIPLIELICGLILNSIDPEGEIQSRIKLPPNASLRFKIWRSKALNYMDLGGNEKIKTFQDSWKELKLENGEIVKISLDDLIFENNSINA